jgi:hypothetical protein
MDILSYWVGIGVMVKGKSAHVPPSCIDEKSSVRSGHLTSESGCNFKNCSITCTSVVSHHDCG